VVDFDLSPRPNGNAVLEPSKSATGCWSGTGLIREFRAAGVTSPILVHTVLDGEIYETASLDAGADDYIVKKSPISILLSRLWLHDLSSADPYHILPILMVVFQLLVQLYTPSPGSDATQQKMVACLMTVGFGYVSWHYPSGLALYALTGSLPPGAIQSCHLIRSGLDCQIQRSAAAWRFRSEQQAVRCGLFECKSVRSTRCCQG
jgi:hypothetical protein